MGKKKKKKNPFYVIHKRITDEPIKTKESDVENNLSEKQISGVSMDGVLFDQIKYKLTDFDIELLQLPESQDEEYSCRKCSSVLRKADNIIIITDNHGKQELR